MRSPRAAAVVGLLALAGAALSCAPEYALYPRLKERKPALGPVEVVSVASVVSGGRTPDPARSDAVARAVLSRSREALARGGYVTVNDSGTAVPCFRDAQARYLIGIPQAAGAYTPNLLEAGASSVAGDVALADSQRAVALRHLVRALRLPEDTGQLPDDSLPQAIAFHRATGVGRLLLAETYVRTVSRRRQVAEGVATGVLTLGHPMWERSLTVLNVYLIDCASGSVLWYDSAMREAAGEPNVLDQLTTAVLGRLP